MGIRDLPALNAVLNGTAALLLFFGRKAVKTGKVNHHKTLMLSGVGVSAFFLSSYLVYHFNTQVVTRYAGQGWDRWMYYSILLTHIPLAILMVPFILMALWFAWRKQFERHARITRWLWWVWMYVSVTGVAIYVMLYLLPQGQT